MYRCSECEERLTAEEIEDHRDEHGLTPLKFTKIDE